MIIGGATLDSGVDTGDIPASLRFRGAQHLSRTFGTPTDNKRSTFSVWAKKAVNGSGATQYLFSANTAPTYTNVGIYSSTDTLGFYNSVSSTNSGNRTTTEVHRDVTGWNHYLVVFDTPNATAEDRMQLWKNGVRITAFSANTAIAQNANPQINAATFHHIGAFAGGEFWNGYMARICFVDGQALTPSSFGYLNTEINEWVTKSQSAVKAVVDAGGTNSFMLDFDDGTSLTTLGYDKSSKGNNWTLNNFSLTAGTSYDWMLDVPGNSFATLNPLDKNTSAVIANANLNITVSGARTSLGVSSGSYYFECYIVAIGTTTNAHIAIADAYAAQNLSSGSFYFYRDDGVRSGGAAVASYTTGDTIGVAFSPSAGTIDFYKNNALQFSLTGVGFSTPWFPLVLPRSTSGEIAFNAGQRPFTYTPPSGYKALCQRNMPDPAILNPEKHFDVKLRTGTGGAVSISGITFPPELIWTKCRNNTWHNTLSDIVRGTTKFLESSTTDAEGTDAQAVTAFNSDGYSLGSFDQVNRSLGSETYVDWLWKAGGAPVTNNAGSISSQVSANVDAGFSIVTYTGTGANATVGHGLGRNPAFIIIKSRSAVTQWGIYFADPTRYLLLSTTGAAVTDSTFWNNTAPGTSVFTLGSASTVNYSAVTYVAYCFAEIPGFSKIFSYTGNGSADGPFVHCGFKPKFILYKRSDNAANWVIWDAIRSPENVVNDYLLPNSSGAEATLDTLDIVSNGFKLRTTNADNNGGTVVGIAFADVPAKYALAR